MLGIDKAKPILRASIDGLNQGKFTEGHELDRKWRVPKAIVGRRLTQGLLLSTTACRDKVLEAAINNKVRACHSPDPPPLKWSDLRYVFDIKEDCNGKEAIQA